MEASIALNTREQKRLRVLNALLAHESTTAEAAASLGPSGRQVRREMAANRTAGRQEMVALLVGSRSV
jgi:hypothetical protein